MTTSDNKIRPPSRPLVDVDGVAELLGVRPRHIRRLVQERRTPRIKWGHLLRFDPVEVDGRLDTDRPSPGSTA